MPNQKLKFAVIGVGGVGGYFGGLLAKSGVPVTFVARGEHYTALKEKGLLLRTVDGEFAISDLDVVDAIEKLDSPDVILLSTKTYDRDEAARRLFSVASESSVVIPLLNGIDNDLKIKELIPHARVIAGLTYIISARTAPGVVEQTAGPRTIFFGERGRLPDEHLRAIESSMKAAGINATAAGDIIRELWTKFVWLTTFAGMTSLCRSSIGPIVDNETAFGVFIRCLDEGFAVAAAKGVFFDDAARTEIVRKSEAYRATGRRAKSSMLVDIEHGRATEIESLNGAMVRLGLEAGVETPVHKVIYSAISVATQPRLPGH